MHDCMSVCRMAVNYSLIKDWLSETKLLLSKYKDSNTVNVNEANKLVDRYEMILNTLRRQVDLEDEGWLSTNPLPPGLFEDFNDNYELLKRLLSSFR